MSKPLSKIEYRQQASKREPSPAFIWPEVRKLCERRKGTDCIYPWCYCSPSLTGERNGVAKR